jgi:hypothetical protein
MSAIEYDGTKYKLSTDKKIMLWGNKIYIRQNNNPGNQSTKWRRELHAVHGNVKFCHLLFTICYLGLYCPVLVTVVWSVSDTTYVLSLFSGFTASDTGQSPTQYSYNAKGCEDLNKEKEATDWIIIWLQCVKDWCIIIIIIIHIFQCLVGMWPLIANMDVHLHEPLHNKEYDCTGKCNISVT